MGIVTGIGDKSLNKNVIVPEIDADLNDYILNKNCIINGLEVIGNTLTAGMCVLKGYRGVLENAETLNGETYIYGKFTLNFYNGITEDLEVDNFDILKTNSEPQDGTINPASINQAGIYYLLLYTYTNGAYVLNSELDTPTYPVHAYEADETDLVKSGAVIESGATTPTPLDTNAHLTEPLRVANTKYVYNQIEEEIDANTTTIGITSNSVVVGNIVLERKAKYVIATVNFTSLTTSYAEALTFGFTFPNGYIPSENVAFILTNKFNNNTGISTSARTNYVKVTLTANQAQPNIETLTQGSYPNIDFVTQRFGYKCL